MNYPPIALVGVRGPGSARVSVMRRTIHQPRKLGFTIIHLTETPESEIEFTLRQLGTNIEPKLNLSFMTCLPRTGYSAPAMNRLHYKAAFVIRFDPNANIESGKIEGSVEHVASYKTQRFNCLDELLSFVGRVLKEVHVEQIEQP